MRQESGRFQPFDAKKASCRKGEKRKTKKMLAN
jgi:hypothetical protein